MDPRGDRDLGHRGEGHVVAGHTERIQATNQQGADTVAATSGAGQRVAELLPFVAQHAEHCKPGSAAQRGGYHVLEVQQPGPGTVGPGHLDLDGEAGTDGDRADRYPPHMPETMNRPAGHDQGANHHSDRESA